MPQPGVRARLVWGGVPRSSPDWSRHTGAASPTLRVALIVATLFFAEAVPFARAGQPARLDSPQHISSNGDESKPPAATDSSSSRTESANSKKEAAVPLEVATPAAQDSGRRTAAPAAEPGQLYFELRYNVDGTDIQGNQDRSF